MTFAWPRFARDGVNEQLAPALTESFFNWNSLKRKPEMKQRPATLTGKRETIPLPIELWGSHASTRTSLSTSGRSW